MQTEDDYWTVEAMRKQGGSFVRALAELASSADDANLHKIKSRWELYWKQYAEIGVQLRTEFEKENPGQYPI